MIVQCYFWDKYIGYLLWSQLVDFSAKGTILNWLGLVCIFYASKYIFSHTAIVNHSQKLFYTIENSQKWTLFWHCVCEMYEIKNSLNTHIFDNIHKETKVLSVSRRKMYFSQQLVMGTIQALLSFSIIRLFLPNSDRIPPALMEKSKTNCPLWGLNSEPLHLHANAPLIELSQHLVASLNHMVFIKSCSIDSRNNQSAKCDVVLTSEISCPRCTGLAQSVEY